MLGLGLRIPFIHPLKKASGPVYPTELKLYLDATNSTSNPGSGTTWFDLTTNQTNGTLLNGAAFNTQAVTFDGSDDYVSLNGLQSYSSAQAHTYMFWVNCSFPNASYMWVLNNGGSSTGTSLIISRDGGTGYQNNRLYFFAQGGNLLYGLGISGGLMAINTWYHIATVYENNVVKFYVDGVFTGQSNTGNWNAGNSTPAIGRWFNGSFPFNGKISYGKVYSEAITGQEVLDDFNEKKVYYGK
jgi:hypothetical protein